MSDRPEKVEKQRVSVTMTQAYVEKLDRLVARAEKIVKKPGQRHPDGDLPRRPGPPGRGRSLLKPTP